ncbi:MAG: hypothetical protein HHJ16_06815 [Polaromonas sp.]|uniref:hypothetical protein n=1 Tax=Polaromonas sp. TaxID=1869339 RepID=UPI00183225E1|nr:hypothetical protein [Polaromonas sp.]NMM09967.1 hypothetical protein [Polaromonas sp.]
MKIFRTLQTLALDIGDSIMKAIGYECSFGKGDSFHPQDRPIDHGVLGLSWNASDPGEFAEYGIWYLGYFLLLSHIPSQEAWRNRQRLRG